ncbi:SpaA isopeptide-forming pilin-related protein [Corynebacterium sp. BF-R-2]|uniref:SpaA isopeptide-forming pilin-related protein n=1 Tax=Corynebacterium sp. BF-R-2 TaxID=2943494 RepID=UPI00211E9953|nr:SpaA isopeptide-forming pilin-related protein [Corynebacterium sp. BF-R-2]MCQ9676351.1 SpaA isopeptide-forming pilin-related protein [Corynebacterium sp. BF-R-2]
MKKHYSLSSSVFVVALCAGLAGPVAAADERVISGNDRGVSASAVDSSRLIDVTFRKIPLNPFDDREPGALPDGGVAGLSFTLFKVRGVDVTTEAGRAAAKKMTVAKAREAGVDKVASELTNAEGKALFTGLHPGLYLVEESAPDTQHDYRLSDPRLIILPLGNPAGTEFEYDSVAVMKGRPSTPPETTIPPVPPKTTTPPVPPETTTPKTTTAKTTSPKVPPETTTRERPGESTTDDRDRPPREGFPPRERTTHPDGPGVTTERGVQVLGEEPPEGGSGSESGSRSVNVLASTGASVLGLVGVGAVLIFAGLWLSRRRKGES